MTRPRSFGPVRQLGSWHDGRLGCARRLERGNDRYRLDGGLIGKKKVEFDITQGQKGPQAENVRITG